jgi:hypothetical protein
LWSGPGDDYRREGLATEAFVTPELLTHASLLLAAAAAAAVADMLVVVHVASAYQVYSQPIFLLIEATIRERGTADKLAVHSVGIRLAHVVCVTLIAIVIPFFGSLMVSYIVTFMLHCYIHATWQQPPVVTPAVPRPVLSVLHTGSAASCAFCAAQLIIIFMFFLHVFPRHYS